MYHPTIECTPTTINPPACCVFLGVTCDMVCESSSCKDGSFRDVRVNSKSPSSKGEHGTARHVWNRYHNVVDGRFAPKIPETLYIVGWPELNWFTVGFQHVSFYFGTSSSPHPPEKKNTTTHMFFSPQHKHQKPPGRYGELWMFLRGVFCWISNHLSCPLYVF